MGTQHPLPILVTGGGRRIGLAIAWHFINQKQPVIVSYRTHYPAIDGLTKAPSSTMPAHGWQRSREHRSLMSWPV